MSSPQGTAWRNPDKVVSCPSSISAANCKDGFLVELDATAMNTVKMPAGAAPTGPPFGLIYGGGNTGDNLPVEVVVSGIYPGVAGASITAGNLLTSNGTDGKVKPQAAATGVNVGIIGMALADAASGERVPILIMRQVMQGG